jgi:hypothetical protein
MMWIRGRCGMRLLFRSVFVSVLALAFLSGCATTQLPLPANGTLEGTLSLDVPPGFAEGATIPQRLEGRINLTFESKAIQAEPVRSHFDGKVTLVITDAQKTRRYVDFAVTLSGDYDGPPNDGWSRAAAQASDLFGLFCKGLQKAEAKPETN